MSRRFIVIVTSFVLSGVAGLECGLMLAQSTAASTLVLLAPGDIKWESGTRPDIVRAPLWGDRAKGPYGMFNRYDGGVHLAAHFHTNELRGLIMSGTWILQIEGSAAKELPAGSYFSVPGKTRHTDTCGAGAACVVYLTGDAPLDFINVAAK